MDKQFMAIVGSLVLILGALIGGVLIENWQVIQCQKANAHRPSVDVAALCGKVKR